MSSVSLNWYVPSDYYFFSFNKIKEMISDDIGAFRIILSPEYGVERNDEFYIEVGDFLNKSSADSYYLCGDGRVIQDGKRILLEKGISELQIGTSIYFNKEAH